MGFIFSQDKLKQHGLDVREETHTYLAREIDPLLTRIFEVAEQTSTGHYLPTRSTSPGTPQTPRSPRAPRSSLELSLRKLTTCLHKPYDWEITSSWLWRLDRWLEHAELQNSGFGDDTRADVQDLRGKMPTLAERLKYNALIGSNFNQSKRVEELQHRVTRLEKENGQLNTMLTVAERQEEARKALIVRSADGSVELSAGSSTTQEMDAMSANRALQNAQNVSEYNVFKLFDDQHSFIHYLRQENKTLAAQLHDAEGKMVRYQQTIELQERLAAKVRSQPAKYHHQESSADRRRRTVSTRTPRQWEREHARRPVEPMPMDLATSWRPEWGEPKSPASPSPTKWPLSGQSSRPPGSSSDEDGSSSKALTVLSQSKALVALKKQPAVEFESLREQNKQIVEEMAQQRMFSAALEQEVTALRHDREGQTLGVMKDAIKDAVKEQNDSLFAMVTAFFTSHTISALAPPPPPPPPPPAPEAPAVTRPSSPVAAPPSLPRVPSPPPPPPGASLRPLSPPRPAVRVFPGPAPPPRATIPARSALSPVPPAQPFLRRLVTPKPPPDPKSVNGDSAPAGGNHTAERSMARANKVSSLVARYENRNLSGR